MRIHHVSVLLAVVLVGAAGCGSSNSTGPGAKPAAPQIATNSSGSAAVNPNGPEVSPSGDIPDNQAYVPYAVRGARLTVKVPEGWSQSAAPGGSVTFTDKLNSINIRTTPAARVPSASSVKPINGGRVTTVQRKAGPAVRLTYLAKSAADPVTGKRRVDAVERYLFFHKGTELLLTLAGPKGADNVDPWKLVTDSVTWR
jgi:hypothetical protein